MVLAMSIIVVCIILGVAIVIVVIIAAGPLAVDKIGRICFLLTCRRSTRHHAVRRDVRHAAGSSGRSILVDHLDSRSRDLDPVDSPDSGRSHCHNGLAPAGSRTL